ncbi:winged helix-turn-helix transcriptional regulator, partial [Mycobacterium tuberculosis]|nr:winged helix-turn-helix transcriptional regulator [Mycobacterium tuberculosis]
GTTMPASAVHALIEIDARPGLRAAELADLLDLDKSGVSRMLRKLIEAGDIVEQPAPDDGRTKALRLTTRGQSTVAAIHDRA